MRSVVWNINDYKLVSCGSDGAVYEWNLQNGKRESECVLKSCSYSGVAISPDSKVIFAVGSDQTIKEISDSSVSLCSVLMLLVSEYKCRRLMLYHGSNCVPTSLYLLNYSATIIWSEIHTHSVA